MATIAQNSPTRRRVGSPPRDSRAGSARHSNYRPPPGVGNLKARNAALSPPNGLLPPLQANLPGAIGPVPVKKRTSDEKAALNAMLSAKLNLQNSGDVDALLTLVRDADLGHLIASGTDRGQMSTRTSSISEDELFYDEDEQYPYPLPPAIAGPFQAPTISTPARFQNIRLTLLLALLNRVYGTEGREYGGRGGGVGRGRRDDDVLYQFNDEESYVGFDKNLIEIQKLLERAKNIDERAYGSTTILTDLDKAGRRRRVDKATSLSQHHQQTQLFDLLSEAKALAGRKPIRVIADELAKRIETLKTNQTEWEAFQKKISEYRTADALRARIAPADMIRYNRHAMSQLQPNYRRQMIAELRREHNHHRAAVYARKREQDWSRWCEKVAGLQKKEKEVEHTKKKEKDKMGKAQTLQQKWFILTAVASRLTLIKLVLEEERKHRADLLARTHAARVIQRVYRAFKRAAYEHRTRLAIAKIAVVFHQYIRRRRERRKHTASNTIRQFFQEVYDVSKLMKVVKKYRFSVVKAQSYVIGWHTVRNAQVDVITRYWEKLEPLWWNQRKGGTGGEEEKKEKAKGKKGRTKKGKDDNADKVPLKISDTAKRSVILSDLIIRRKQYRKQIAQYEKDLAAFNASHKSGKGDVGPPKRPVFKLLPPQPEMLALIEKGFLEATSSGLR